MPSRTSLPALFMVLTCSMVSNLAGARVVLKDTIMEVKQQQPAELRIEPFYGAPANQEVEPTGMTEVTESGSLSEESSEEDDMDVDTDTDTDNDVDTANGSTAASINIGALPNTNVELVNDAGVVSGNQLPIKGRPDHMPSNQDVRMTSSSSNATFGIAIAAMIMVGLGMGSIVFVVKKYRHHFPVVVRV
ncbi:uncharacterized protein LOC129260524 [Lytechinus pictus]|uniref:uncharacterized protein LOC129260524 n=1 Tax=Lytechinus pictus TaxID=7653 RepID=UPI0030B9BB0D